MYCIRTLRLYVIATSDCITYSYTNEEEANVKIYNNKRHYGLVIHYTTLPLIGITLVIQYLALPLKEITLVIQYLILPLIGIALNRARGLTITHIAINIHLL